MSKAQERALRAAEANAIRRGSAVQKSLNEMRRMIQATIPKSFQWWITIDPAENRIEVDYIWLGHPRATPRQCADADFSIVWLQLNARNWDAEIKETLAEISAEEVQILQGAQERRERRVVDEGTVLTVAPSVLEIEMGAGGESPPDRPAAAAEAAETGRGSRQKDPTARRSRRPSTSAAAD